MIDNSDKYVSIADIDVVVHHKNEPGNEYGFYRNGRGICGLVVAFKGKSLFTFRDGSSQEISAGESVLFSDRVAYVVTNNGTEPFDHLTVNFSLNKGFSFDADMIIKPVNFNTFIDKCSRLVAHWNSGRPASRMRCVAVLYELIADVLENNVIDEVGLRSYSMVMPAIRYIDDNYNIEINIDYLAKLCVMSRTNFRRMFTAVCGTSPIQYLLDVRIRRAKEMLSGTGYSISDIAHMCGFKDVEHFCRMFKKRTGITAGMMRKK